MEREEKGGERDKEKRESLGMIKLKRGDLVGKTEGTCTTPSPTWRFGLAQTDGSLVQDSTFPSKTLPTYSARKLAANLWEFHQPQFSSMSKANKAGRSQHQRDKGPELMNPLPQLSSIPQEQPSPSSSLRRHVTASLMQNHQLVEGKGHNRQPVSPASYSSSLEIYPYKPTITLAMSPNYKGRLTESSYSLKTSRELLKVLNRIWSLEEQHASNISLVKALKRELDHSKAQIKELQQEKKRERKEMDGFVKQLSEDNIVKNNKDHERIKDAMKSVRDELKDERKLRKHSETIHRKLALELSEVKSSFSNSMKELERENKDRILLEDLCDEFAKGIRDYERQVRVLKHKSGGSRIVGDHNDGLILHISEAWLDERMQAKVASARCNQTENRTVVEKLRYEIEAFLRARKYRGSGKDVLCSEKAEGSHFRGHSLESFHLNEAGSAPQCKNDEEDSFDGVLDYPGDRGLRREQSKSCRKQNGETALRSHVEAKVKLDPKKVQSQVVLRDADLSNFEVGVNRHMSGDIIRGNCKTLSEITGPVELRAENPYLDKNMRNIEKGAVSQEVLSEIIANGKDTKKDLHNISAGCTSSSVGGKDLEQEKARVEDYFDPSTFTGAGSPVQKWTSESKAPEMEVSMSSCQHPRKVKENTLKAKLLEARLEGRQSRSKSSGHLP